MGPPASNVLFYGEWRGAVPELLGSVLGERVNDGVRCPVRHVLRSCVCLVLYEASQGRLFWRQRW